MFRNTKNSKDFISFFDIYFFNYFNINLFLSVKLSDEKVHIISKQCSSAKLRCRILALVPT